MPPDPYRYFRIEVRELLDEMGRLLLAPADGPGAGPDDAPARLRRLTHTLKGAAAVVGETGIAEAAHTIEDLLAGTGTGGGEAGPVRHRLLEIYDCIVERASALGAPRPPSGEAGRTFADVVRERPGADELEALQADLAEVHAGVSSAASVVARLDRARRLTEELRDSLATLAGRLDSPEQARDLDRSRQLGEDLRELLRGDARDVAREVDGAVRTLGSARAAVDRLRLVPVSSLFTPLGRVVRETARSTGRLVRFEASGDVRLDEGATAVLRPALVQLVRNAVAHGIEPPERRVAAGKREEGTVWLRVSRPGEMVSFSCEDDGGGVDIEAVRTKVGAGPAVPPADILSRLLDGGISTAERVTGDAGRGVGLDVVREAGARLGGAGRSPHRARPRHDVRDHGAAGVGDPEGAARGDRVPGRGPAR